MRVIQKSDELLKKLLPEHSPCPDRQYIPSRFVLSLEHEGRKYVFNTLTRELLEAELPESTGAGCGYDELIRRYFLVPRDKDENAFYMDIANLFRAWEKRKKGKEPTLHTLYLHF